MAKLNLEKLTVIELEQLKADAEQTIVAKRKADRLAAFNAAKEAAAKYGFTLAELFGEAKKSAKTKTASAPKYAHPENASVTWTGRGRQPGWIKDAIVAGKSLDEFLIQTPELKTKP